MHETVKKQSISYDEINLFSDGIYVIQLLILIQLQYNYLYCITLYYIKFLTNYYSLFFCHDFVSVR